MLTSDVSQPSTVLSANTSTTTPPSVLNTQLVSPFAALQEIVKTHTGKKPEVAQQQEQLSSEQLALCRLLARILMRCLKEQDVQVLTALSLASEPEGATTGGTHDPAV